MLTHLIIDNYQSLRHAEFELGGFTVITGPTGAGKSAVLRALRLAAFNQLGSDFISRGQKTCKVLVGDQNEGWAACIERGKTSGKDSYRVVALDPDAEGETKTWTYTKLDKKVPPEVAELLAFDELNFAGQLDRPYLLDASGGQIARVLGELTNVTLLFDAAREGARRKGELVRDLKRVERDITDLTEQLHEYRWLSSQREAIAAAEQTLATAQQTAAGLASIRTALSAYQEAREALVVQQRAQPVLPSLEAAEALAARLTGLRQARAAWESAHAAREVARQESVSAGLAAEAAHREFHARLVKAGKCPMCGQAVTEFTGLAGMFVKGAE